MLERKIEEGLIANGPAPQSMPEKPEAQTQMSLTHWPCAEALLQALGQGAAS